MDTQKQIMGRLIKQAIVNRIAPHLYHLYIVWQDTITLRPDVALLWRGVGVREGNEWNQTMDEIVTQYYSQGKQAEIMRMIPKFSWCQIKDRAKYLKVPRETRQRANDYYHTVSFADLEAGANFTETPEEEEYMYTLINDLAAHTQKGEITAYWPLPIDIISFVSAVKRTDDERNRP